MDHPNDERCEEQSHASTGSDQRLGHRARLEMLHRNDEEERPTGSLNDSRAQRAQEFVAKGCPGRRTGRHEPTLKRASQGGKD